MATLIREVESNKRHTVIQGDNTNTIIVTGSDSEGSGGSGVSADLLSAAPARFAGANVAAGRYNWNSRGIWSNETWQIGAYLDSTETPIAWRRPVGSYDRSDREYIDLSTIPSEPFGVFEDDSHNIFDIAIDRNDNVIIFANHHNDPVNWVYWDASQVSPDFTDPDQWTVGGTMVDAGTEDLCTYFPFVYEPVSDRLLLFHSNGVGAGNSSRYINLWDPDTLTWSRVGHFFDGESTSPTETAYPHFALRDDGMIGCFFTWHEWGEVADSDHDICYAQSPDGGITWERIDGTNYTLPIRFNTGDNHEADVIYPVVTGTSMKHGGGAAFDINGNPWFMLLGENQVRWIIRWNGNSWIKTDMPSQYSGFTGMVPGEMFFYDDRLYVTGCNSLQGRDGDFVLIDITDPTDIVEFPVIKGIATQGLGGDFDREAFRLRGKFEKMVGPMRDTGQENAWTGVPLILTSIDLDQLPILRTGNSAPIGIDESVELSSKTGEFWTVSGASFSLLPGAPRWIAPTGGGHSSNLVLAKLHVIGNVASGTTLSVGLFAGYSPEAPVVDISALVQFGYINITSTLESYESGWLVIPVIPFGEGFLYGYQVYLAALASGSATGNIEHLKLEIATVGGVRFP